MCENLEQFSQAVVEEMLNMKNSGTFVPELALEQAADLSFVEDYEGMEVCECAQLLVSLSQL
jgi:hypothetical protein